MREGPCTPCGCQRETGIGTFPLAFKDVKIVGSFVDMRNCCHELGSLIAPSASWESCADYLPECEPQGLPGSAPRPGTRQLPSSRTDGAELQLPACSSRLPAIELDLCVALNADQHRHGQMCKRIGNRENDVAVPSHWTTISPGEHVAIRPEGSCLRRTTSVSPQISAPTGRRAAFRAERRSVPPTPAPWFRGRSGRKRPRACSFLRWRAMASSCLSRKARDVPGGIASAQRVT